ncbi:lipase 3-like [Polistes fuscatus]|uniref:lipase 3-like n=1 Tax=Polistes fuscatus TaxID=30207 RepID=UPI001CA7EFFE|nr:lipase 3-like [Polistes fuscatus]
MQEKTNQDDEIHMTTPELIEHHGYISETHYIWTEDDYCLTVHRIIGPKTSNVQLTNSNVTSNTEQIVTDDLEKSNLLNLDKSTLTGKPESINPEDNSSSRPPVIINHGVLSSSADWVLLGPQKALAYTLCQAGYDVWLANARGNAYSKKHKIYTPKNREFWDFSYHEVGYYDIPAIIDYVLEKTAHSVLSYIGYSQGTTAFYVMGSERPEYNAKVKVMVSLAPIAFLYNQQSPLLKLVVHFYNLVEWGSSYCNIHQWFPHSKLQARAVSTIIRNAPPVLTNSFCNCWFHVIAGFGSNQLDKDMFPLIFGHFPAGVSAKQIIHYSQGIVTGSFRKFDYGINQNLKRYGSTQPPKYNLKKVNVPVAIFYGENDSLTHYLDVQKIIDELPNVIETKKIEYSKFNHVDFLWGRDAKTLVYNSVVAVLKRF